LGNKFSETQENSEAQNPVNTGSVTRATPHLSGWCMVNVLDVPFEDVAIAPGHTDGGELVRRLYSHRDSALASFTQGRLW
jgi:hypothetical protein